MSPGDGSEPPSGPRLLKADLFGRIAVEDLNGEACVVRDTTCARWWTKLLARRLAAREAKALRALAGLADVAQLRGWDGKRLTRSWIPGAPLHEVGAADPRFFDALRRLVVRLHRRNVVHNDLAKQPNVLVQPDGRPALVDFQLAAVHRRRGRWFRLCGREDLRHLLKHKRRYFAPLLTPRERAILASPSGPARVWMRTGKPVYLFVTRRLLGWSDREGSGERGSAA